jgi:hypothetical protein
MDSGAGVQVLTSSCSAPALARFLPSESTAPRFPENDCHGAYALVRGGSPASRLAIESVPPYFVSCGARCGRCRARILSPNLEGQTGCSITSVRAFLFQVARNVAIDSIRNTRASPVDPLHDCSALNPPGGDPGSKNRRDLDYFGRECARTKKIKAMQTPILNPRLKKTKT